MTDARPVRIVTDSATDLPPGVPASMGITVVPLVVLFGDDVVQEPLLTPDDFWERAGRSSRFPGTSQPSPGAFASAFAELVEQGYDVVCITITSRHSGTYSTACTAARAFGERVAVVDSHAISMGGGYPVMEAARLARSGATQQQVLRHVLSLRARGRILIHLESLEHVRNGGRAAVLMPLVDRLARAISLKPILTMVGGELRLLGVARSTGRSLIRISQEIARLGPLEHLLVMHVRAPEGASRMVELLAPIIPTGQQCVSIGEAGPVLACHGGPGVVGVAAWPLQAEGAAAP